MKTFSYYDNNNNHKLVFQIQAMTITEADKLYAEQFGIYPFKQPYIGCTIE